MLETCQTARQCLIKTYHPADRLRRQNNDDHLHILPGRINKSGSKFSASKTQVFRGEYFDGTKTMGRREWEK